MSTLGGAVPHKRFLAYLGCSFSIGVFSSFNNFTLTLWLASFTSSYLLLGLLGNSKSFEGAIVSPLTGAWSDRVWAGWLGRRRPFILVGGLLSALVLALTPTISRLPLDTALGWLSGDVRRLAPAIVAIFLFTLAFNSMDDIHKALLADVARPLERNALSALSVVVDMAGEVLILVVGFLFWKESVPDATFVVTGVLVAIGVLVTVAGVREPQPTAWQAQRARQAAAAGPQLSRLSGLAHHRGAVVFCLVIFATGPALTRSCRWSRSTPRTSWARRSARRSFCRRSCCSPRRSWRYRWVDWAAASGNDV